MENPVIVGALRTPTGRLLGALSSLSAPRLGAAVIEALIKKAGIKPSLVDEVIMGNVVSAGLGQNPARQAAVMAGLPKNISAFTVNKVCGSGLKAVALAAQAVKAGDAEIVVAGGMESMSNTPFLLRDLRAGKKMGGSELVDSMIHDGLWDFLYNAHMGTLCEHTAKKYGITRKEQDAFALASHRKAMAAARQGKFMEEIVPVAVESGKKNKTVLEDETIRWDTGLKKLARLAPAFGENGSITAGNSPGLNDGAAALLVLSERKAEKLNVRPLARISGYATAFRDPKWYPLAPLSAVKAVLKKTGKKPNDFDFVEINEAFAAQTLAVMKELDLNPSRLNVNGGAIALGHPIGASGARILVTLVHLLTRRRRKGNGLAAICLGGGGAVSMTIETMR